MKNLWLVALCMLCVSPVFASDTLELQVINGKPTVDLFAANTVRGAWGWSAFALGNSNWAQVYAGPTYAPTPWCELSASVGVELGGTRWAQSVFLRHGRRIKLLAIHEDGASGHWHKIVLDFSAGKGVFVGFHSQGFIGQGFRAGFKHKKVSVWGALLLKQGDLNTIAAATVSN